MTSQHGGTFRDWDTLAQDFLEEYYPQVKTATVGESISQIHEREGESLYDMWNRFQELLSDFPHHGYTDSQVVDVFNRSLDRTTLILVHQLGN